jgi:hypothetical protein
MSRHVLGFLLVFLLVPCLNAQNAHRAEESGDAIALAPVAAPAPAPAPTADDGLTWKDAKTSLVWQRTAASRDMEWKSGGEYCDINRTGLPGENWRLPTIEELRPLLLDEGSGGCRWPRGLDGPCGIFWSGTSAKSTSEAHYVDFSGGFEDFDDKGYAYHVRCVRDGP